MTRTSWTFLLWIPALAAAAPGERAAPSTRTSEGPRLERVLRRDAIPAIRAPHFVPVDRSGLPDDAPVMGFAVGDQAHVYGLDLLNHHEIVNDQIGALAFAATW